MATWHQKRDMFGLRALWAPDPKLWKVVCDRPGEFSHGFMFRTRREAQRTARKTGGALVAPLRYTARKGAALA